MLTAEQIALQLQEFLPLLTDRFHDTIPVASAVVSSGILTIVFPGPHGLAVDDEVHINDVLIKNRLSAAVLTGDDTIRYTTENEHDLTAFMKERPGRQYPEGKTVTLQLPAGDTVVTLDPTAAGVPASNMFEGIEGSVQPPITGSEYLIEKRSDGAVGFKTVATVPNDTTITISLADVPPVPDGPLIMSNIVTNIRVTSAADFERAEKVYTSQGEEKDYLFVLMLDRDASKDRVNNDDFVSVPASQLRLLNIRQNFAVVAFSSTVKDLAGVKTKSFVYGDLFRILLQILYGWKDTSYLSDGQTAYNTSYYAHAYNWETRQQVDNRDGFINNKSVALRHLSWEQVVFDEGESNANIEFP